MNLLSRSGMVITRLIKVLTCLCTILFFLISNDSLANLLKSDYAKGKVSLDQFLQYRLKQFTKPADVPAKYLAPVNGKEVSMVYLEAAQNWDKLSDATQAMFSQVMARPGGVDTTAFDRNVYGATTVNTYTTTNFMIHYVTTGTHAVPVGDSVGPNSAVGADGFPDYVNQVGDLYESSRTTLVTMMGYSPPPLDIGDADFGTAANPDSRFDVYLYDIDNLLGTGAGASVYGLAVPLTSTVTGNSGASYMAITTRSNITSVPLTTNELTLVIAHEFHHSIQMGMAYYAAPWYFEATSEWIEQHVFTSIYTGYGWLTLLQANPDISLGTRPYPAAIDPLGITLGYQYYLFNDYFSDYSSADTIRNIWTQLGIDTNAASPNVFPGMNTLLGFRLGDHFANYSRFNLDTSLYADANVATYPVTITSNQGTITADGTVSMVIDHMATNYVQFTPNSATDTLYIGFNGPNTSVCRVSVGVNTGGTFTFSQLSLDAANDVATAITDFGPSTATYLIFNNVSTTTADDDEPFELAYSITAAPGIPANATDGLTSVGDGGGTMLGTTGTATANTGNAGGANDVGGCFIKFLSN